MNVKVALLLCACALAVASATHGSLTVTVQRGHNLKAGPMQKDKDHFVEVIVGNQKKKTASKETKDGNPVWGERFEFPTVYNSQKVHFSVVDIGFKGLLSTNSEVGTGVVPVSSLPVGQEKTVTVDISRTELSFSSILGGPKSQGKIDVTFKYVQGCPKGCSGHGTCTNGVCTCQGGFTGVDCATPVPAEVKTCPNNCSNQGTCNTQTGVCACNAGFNGADCAQAVLVNTPAPTPTPAPESTNTVCFAAPTPPPVQAPNIVIYHPGSGVPTVSAGDDETLQIVQTGNPPEAPAAPGPNTASALPISGAA